MRITWRSLAKNIVFLVLVALPLWVSLLFLQALVLPPDWMREPLAGSWSVRDIASGFAFWYLAMLGPVLAGGILHQVLTAAIPRSWSRRHIRGAMLLATIIIPGCLVLLSPDPNMILSPRALAPAAVAMLLFGTLAAPVQPPTPEAGPPAGAA